MKANTTALQKALEKDTRHFSKAVALGIGCSLFSSIAFLVAFGMFRGDWGDTNPDTKYMLEYKRTKKEELGSEWDSLTPDEQEAFEMDGNCYYSN
jgi:hypothetical protein